MDNLNQTLASRHLDIGCGTVPRNPYYRQELHAVDTRSLRSEEIPEGIRYTQANFAVQPLPFPDGYFDSVSAFDVIEHVPRQLLHPNGTIIYPFISLMNEVHRVLKNDGVFLATTPGYPHPEAFQDPTHVNIITLKTAEYFSGDERLGKMYGFTGKFEISINKYCVRNNYFQTNISSLTKIKRRWHRTIFKGGLTHIIWELIALK